MFHFFERSLSSLNTFSAMSLSTLRAPISRDSLTSLTDDSLLVILGYLSVPQLLTFLSISRRLNSLIVQYTLPDYRTIHLPNLPDKIFLITTNELLKPSIFLSRRCYSHSTFYLSATSGFDREWPLEPSHFLSVPLFKTQLSSFPLDLPLLLCRLQHLTFTYFLDDRCLLSEEEKLANRCLTVYLHSSWSETLVSLKLYFDIGKGSQKDTCLFAQLNNLHSLKHLFLHFIPNGSENIIQLLDSFPVLSQLHSFYLEWYEGSNTVTLIHQLGPNLAFLSLCECEGDLDDVLRSLCSKPSYRKTLTTLELHLSSSLCLSQWSTLTSSFPALVHFSGLCSSRGDSLYTFFTLLGRFSQLREILMFKLSIEDLRVLRDSYPPHRLPTLQSIRRLGLHINCTPAESSYFEMSELFDDHLPLLGAIFCAAENVEFKFAFNSMVFQNIPLSRQLANKVKEHFPFVRNCEAHRKDPSYYVRAWSRS